MDDDEERIDIKLRLADLPETKQNGKPCINALLANFKCGLPSPVTTNTAQFSLFKNKKNKNQLLLVEDEENNTLYYDKRIPSFCSSTPQPTRFVGVFDRDSNEVNLITVSDSFDMKPIMCNKDGIDSDDDNDNKDAIEKHEDLVDTFGSKFALVNMRKQQKLRKIKDAQTQAIDRMNTAELINEDEDDDIDTKSLKKSDIYQTENISKRRKRKRKRSDMENDDDNNDNKDNRDYSSEEHKTKYINIFQHKFSKSPYCLWEFPYHQDAKRISYVYLLQEIIPNHIWTNLDEDTIWNAWNEWNDTKHQTGLKPMEFTLRGIAVQEQIKNKKKATFKQWCQILALYDITVHFLNNMNYRPYCCDVIFWQSLKAGYLEQNADGNSNNQLKHKRIKYCMTRRGKMRIVGIILLLALKVGNGKLSMNACNDISTDLKIPKRVILSIYRLLGCSIDDKTVVMRTHIVHRQPTTSVDGEWWSIR